MPLLRDGLLEADALVDVLDLLPRGIDGTRIGAATTLAELEAADADSGRPARGRAPRRLAAAPQHGHVAGNLLQATRCWYWRLKMPCRLHGGDTCLAAAGEHREHAVFGNELLRFRASVRPGGGARGARRDAAHEPARASVAELYRLPTEDDRRTTTLDPGELILELDVPPAGGSAYLKAMERKRWSFPIVGVAAVRRGDETTVALAGVAPIPWLLDGGASTRRRRCRGTAYKVEIAPALVRRARAAVA